MRCSCRCGGGGLAWAAGEPIAFQRDLGGAFLESVSMLPGGQEGWATGQFGRVLHTTDGGANWTPESLPAGLSSSAVIDVKAVDATHVFAVGRGPALDTPLLLMRDGAGWTKVSLPPAVTKKLMALDMVSSTVGYAVGPGGAVVGTTDGLTWTVLSTNAVGKAFDVAHDPLDAQTLWVCGEDGVFESTDAGQSWSLELTAGNYFSDGSTTTGTAPFAGRELSVYGDTIVIGDFGPGSIAGNGAGILSSQDGGTTWSYQPWLGGNMLRPQMLSVSVGYALDMEFRDLNGLYKTTDGGKTWTIAAFAGGATRAAGIDFIDQTTGWVVGAREMIVRVDLSPGAEPITFQTAHVGRFLEAISMLPGGLEGWTVGQFSEILHTTDGGATWQPQAVPAGLSGGTLNTVSAVDASHVWASGRSDATGTPLMLLYDGASWSKVTLPGAVTKFVEVDMVSTTLGYAISRDGSVLRTTDGSLWSMTSTSTLKGKKIAHDPTAPQSVWILRRPGIYRSLNGGVTWSGEMTAGKYQDPLGQTVNSAFSGAELSVYGQTIVASGWEGDVLSSQDGGASWTYVPGVGGGFLSPQLLDASVGIAVDNETLGLNRIFKTTDGGLAWKTIATAGAPMWAGGNTFIDQTTGWVVGEDDLIVKIDLGGGAEPVTFQSNPTGGLFESVSMLADGSEGWTVGQHGLVMHTADGSWTWTRQAIPFGLSGSALIDVKAIDRDHIWAVGRRDATGTPLILFYGGATWTEVTVPGGVTRQLMAVAMASSTFGYALGRDGSVLGTTDGSGWTVLGTVTTTQPGDKLLDLAADSTDSKILWAIGNTGVFESTDGGATWSAEKTAGKYFLDGSTVTGTNPFVGRHISVYGNTIVAGDLGPQSIGSFQNGFYFKTGAGLISSRDGGATWTYHPEIGQNFLRPQMLSATLGFALDVEMDELNGLYKTTDGGLTWALYALAGGPGRALGLDLQDAETGVVVGENEMIVKLNPGVRPAAAASGIAGGGCAIGAEPRGFGAVLLLLVLMLVRLWREEAGAYARRS